MTACSLHSDCTLGFNNSMIEEKLSILITSKKFFHTYCSNIIFHISQIFLKWKDKKNSLFKLDQFQNWFNENSILFFIVLTFITCTSVNHSVAWLFKVWQNRFRNLHSRVSCLMVCREKFWPNQRIHDRDTTWKGMYN